MPPPADRPQRQSGPLATLSVPRVSGYSHSNNSSPHPTARGRSGPLPTSAFPASAPTTPAHLRTRSNDALPVLSSIQVDSSPSPDSATSQSNHSIYSQVRPLLTPTSALAVSTPRSLLLDDNSPRKSTPSYPDSDLKLQLGPGSRHRVSATTPDNSATSTTPQKTPQPADEEDEESEDDKYRKHRGRRRMNGQNGHVTAASLLSPSFYLSLSWRGWLTLLAVVCSVALGVHYFFPSVLPLSFLFPSTTPSPSPQPVRPPPHLSRPISNNAQPPPRPVYPVGASIDNAPVNIIPPPDDDENWKKQICGVLDENSDNMLCADGTERSASLLIDAATPNNVTFFTVFVPESDHDSTDSAPGKHKHTSWLRAIYSWTLQTPNTQHVMVLVRQQDHCDYLRDLPSEVYCRVTACFGPEAETPFLKCVLEDAAQRAETALMVYVEDHIVLFNDFVPALLKTASALDRFFVVGSSTSLTLSVDADLDLKTWHKDVEAAIFLDSSNADSEKEHSRHADTNHSHSLHFFAYSKGSLDLTQLDNSVLMGGGQYYGHEWEKILVAYLLLQDKVTLVDVTQAVTAIEMTHADKSNYTAGLNVYNRLHTVNNTAVPHVSLGRLENSHYVLIGKCPTCSLKENREADLPLVLIRHANTARQIIVILVNSNFLSLAFNWICRARFLGLSNYVMLAEDRVAYRILRKMDVPVILRRDAPYTKQAAMPGSAEFQETLYLRALFFKDVVGLGFHLILSHLDTIWFEDPLPMLAASDCDMYIQMEGSGSRADGGMLTIKSTSLGYQFSKDYLICEQENWDFITVHGKSRFFYSDDPDMNCVDLISQRLVRRNHLKRCILDPSRYVSETVFFDLQSSQERGIYPAFVHINRARGLYNKTKAFIDWDLWAVDDSAMARIPSLRMAHTHGTIQCKAPPHQLRAPLFEDRERMRIVVNILASIEHGALQQTLEHLAAAQYNTNVPVDLRLTVQLPEHDSQSNTKQYVRAVAIAKEFDWPHGDKKLLFIEEHVGPTDRWLDYWELGAEGEQVFQLALQAGQMLSERWFVWVKAALEAYYFNPFQYSSQLMGIHLQHQFTIVGETPAARFGSRIPSTVLSSGNGTTPILYHYQFLPLFGTVFFPHHFLSFLHWYSLQNHSTIITASLTTGAATANYSPIACVPTLISNSWYKSDSIQNWWQWLVRFTFESGWFALYTNFHSPQDNRARALVVDETPLAGQLTVELVKRLGARENEYAAKEELQLYDLHFNRFNLDKRMLAVRKSLFPPMAASRRPRTSVAELQESVEQERVLAQERDRWSKERGGGGSDAETEGEGEVLGGLWARIHSQRRDQELSEVGEEQVEESEEAVQAELTVDEAITPTDIIVEMMKNIMVDSDSESSAAEFDTKAYRGQLARIAAKLQHIRAGEQHIHRDVRGSQHDRCFVIGDKAIEEPVDVKIIDAVSALPPPYNLSLTVTELYTHIYQSVMLRLPPKPSPLTNPQALFIVYRPRQPVPWDRHLRGLYFTFLTALVTGRVFLVDSADLESMYDCPFPGVKWTYKAFEPYFTSSAKVKVSTAEMDSKKITAELRTRFLNDIFPQQVIYHTEAVSHDRLMFTNVAYKPYALALFDTRSRMKRTGMLMRLLQSKPKNALIQASKDLQKQVGLTAVKYALCVHVVAPPEKVKKSTEADPLPGVPDSHWECVVSQLLHLGFTKDDVVIFFTSNAVYSSSLDVASQRLSRYGRVVGNPHFFEPGATNWGTGNATIRASQQRDPLSNALIYDPYIVHNYLFGECDVTVSSGTTYGIFGAARTGFSKAAYVFRPAGPPQKAKDKKSVPIVEEDYCGPMHRIDMERENDINF